MSTIFHLFFYNPLYNALVFILSVLPHASVAVAVIILTIIVRLILFPLSKGAVQTQMKLKEIEPQVNALKEKFKDNREKQAQEMMALYKANKINPFASFLFLLIQLPIIFALYFIFFKGGLPAIDASLLYSFVTAPLSVDMHLFWFDISKPQIIFGALAAGTQFLQAQLSVPPHKPSEKPGFQDDLARSMNIQIRYVLPAIVFAISFTISGAVALYWITGNVFTILQELYLRRTRKQG